ncbi:hypothetical protein DICPUDRAFT_97686 [Dictyostelium purpureum]|uniref:Uncharacterized protein n=1 Tax=Dictyostelium purpureum TaxID=5786 RepID=F0ZIY0_DICPU|nr:uncharacterized protein DICPUDRAFT_97686 [Dictyostelium purpureum]EGC36104.1 hypothetical protein DICPUDRAFT_97686 [Dictyostelium purpureum]|eukprot:XP_003287361.1 hypothetical protein DICPUDRAFT_97686 [Dictyostelium purpureum]
MYTSTKPYIFLSIICIITFISFSFILINFNNTIFTVETYEYSGDSFNYYNLNRYHYKYQFLDHESNITISNNGNILSTIQRTKYSPESPLYRFFKSFFYLSAWYLILLVFMAFLLFILHFTKLLKCNYEFREMIRNGEMSAFMVKRKRDICITIVSVFYLAIVGITFGIAVALPLNLPTYFIKQDRFNHFTDNLCNTFNINSTIGLHHFGKCSTSSGQITMQYSSTDIYMKYSWGIGEYFVVIRSIILTTALVGLFLFLLLCLLKYKKPASAIINNDPNNNNNENSINSIHIPMATVTPIGKSIYIS